jgi:hypothetical protein
MTARGHQRAVTFVGLAAALVVLALACSYFMRNTSGARGTGQPGALAGNLATVLVLAIVIAVAVIVGVAALR